MSKLPNCIQFQSRTALKSTLWFLGIYFAIYLTMFLSLWLMVKSSPNSSGNMQSGFFIAGTIFTFIYVSANYKPNFNFLLMFGNTRRNIFLSSIVTFAGLSLFIAVVSVLSQSLDNVFTNELSRNSRNSVNLINVIYQNNVNPVTEFLWYLTLFVMISSLAMLYGAMAYKFGKVFITVFWVGFGLCWTVLPVMTGGKAFAIALKAYFCTGISNGILLAPINFIITAVIFCAVTYALSTRQSQVV